jgi:predicted dehydrogenase
MSNLSADRGVRDRTPKRRSRARESAPRMLRIGVIGAGRFAHLYHLPAILADERAALAVICDPAPSQYTQDIAARADVPVVSDLRSALSEFQTDAVVISTPHRLHGEQIRAALETGHHVLVDKPFVMESDEANELSGLARRMARIGSVAFNQRFSSAYLYAKDVIANGKLGRLRRIETVQLGGQWIAVADGNIPRQTGPQRPAWYLDPKIAGGGVLVGRGAHMADIVPWIVGQPPVRLRATVANGGKGQVDQGGTADIDFGDLTWRFTTVADQSPLWDDVRIYGSQGRIEISKPEGTLGYWDARHEAFSGPKPSTPDPGIDNTAFPNFLDAISGLTVPRCSFSEACVSVRILEAMYESGARRGAWIVL